MLWINTHNHRQEIYFHHNNNNNVRTFIEESLARRVNLWIRILHVFAKWRLIQPKTLDVKWSFNSAALNIDCISIFLILMNDDKLFSPQILTSTFSLPFRLKYRRRELSVRIHLLSHSYRGKHNLFKYFLLWNFEFHYCLLWQVDINWFLVSWNCWLNKSTALEIMFNSPLL